MNLPIMLAAALLVAAAVVAVRPAPATLSRLDPHPARPSSPRRALGPLRGQGLRSPAVRAPRRFVTAVCVAGAAVGAPFGGPVAALLCGIYAALGAAGFARRSARGIEAAARACNLDTLTAVAADLRAGTPAGDGLGAVGGRLGALAVATERLARETGAPVADLVDRIEADARAADRARAAAAAQAAGAGATAVLLAVLPLGGTAIGYGMGADPLHVMLHTPIGAACSVAAALLQVTGLLWTNRLIRGPRP